MRGVLLLLAVFLGSALCFQRHLHRTSHPKKALLKISSFDINILPKDDYKKKTLEETSDRFLALTKYSFYLIKITLFIDVIKDLVV